MMKMKGDVSNVEKKEEKSIQKSLVLVSFSFYMLVVL